MPYYIDPKTKQRIELDPKTGQPIGQSMTSTGGVAPQQPQKESFFQRLVKSFVKPVVDYGSMVGGAGYEVYRAGKSALGDENAYIDKQGKNVANPFLNQQELETFSKPGSAALEGTKRAAGMASYFIPGGKLAEGAGVGAKILQGAAMGAKAGGLYGFSQSKANDLEGLATDTVKGSVTGGVTGGVIGGVGGVVSKFKGAKAGTQAKVINPDVPASPTMIAKKKEIVDELGKMGISGKNAEDIASKVGSKYKELGDQAVSILDSSSKTKSWGRLQAVLKKQLNENGEYYIPDDPRYSKLLDRELTLLSKKVDNGKLTAKALYDFKNELASKLNNGFRKESGDLSSPISDIEGVRLDLWKNIDDVITNIEPEVKEITKQMSFLHKASPGLKKSMEAVKEARPLGIPTGLNLNKTLQNIQSNIANIVSGVGGIPDSIPGAVSNAATKGATMFGISEQSKQPATEPSATFTPGETPQQQTGEQPMAEPYVSPDGQWQTLSDGRTVSMDGQWMFDEQADDWVPNTQQGDTGGNDVNPDAPMSRQQYNQQLAALAGNSSTAAVRQYGLLQKERDYYYPETKLSANAQKRIGILNQSEGIYNMVEGLALGAGTGVGAWFKSKAGKLPGVEGGKEEDLDRVNLALAKGLAGALANEVGVATDRDIERWLGLMPKVTDTMEERQRALQRLKQEIVRSRQQIEAQTQDPMATGGMQDYFFQQGDTNQ